MRDVASAHNETGVTITAAATALFSGWLKLGQNTGDCLVVEGGRGLQSFTCENSDGSNAELRQGIDLSDTFVGRVTDSANPEESGDGTACVNAISDWLSFEHPLRGWGRTGTTFPAEGRCTGDGVGCDELCAIWDWGVLEGDRGDPGPDGAFGTGNELPALLEATGGTPPNGDNIVTHVWSGLTPCEQIAGASVDGDSSDCVSVFLDGAIELPGDHRGNDNGLCESDEDCLWQRNIGSYQGHGDRITAGPFVDGQLTGIQLFAYSENGWTGE